MRPGMMALATIGSLLALTAPKAGAQGTPEISGPPAPVEAPGAGGIARPTGPRHATESAIPALRPGARVRATLGSRTRESLIGAESVMGRVLQTDDQSIVLEVEGLAAPVQLPLSSIRRLDLSLGMGRDTGHGFVVGAGVGLGAGVLFGWSLGALDDGSGTQPGSQIWGAVIGGGAGSLVGGLVGAGIGSLVEIERWERIAPDRVSLAVAPAGRHGLAASLSVAF
jgi:hypothetical protein